MADIAARMVQLRRDQNLTQQEMAARIGIHVNQVRRYEAGNARPSLEVVEKIALTLHVSLDWLVFGDSNREPMEDLKLQFEALQQFDADEIKVAKELLESLILKHNAKRAFAS